MRRQLRRDSARGGLRGPGPRVPQGAEDADALHAAGLDAGRPALAQGRRCRASAGGSRRRRRRQVHVRQDRPGPAGARELPRRSWTSAGATARGKTVRTERAISPVCKQPDARPDLVVRNVRVEDGGYVGVVFNRGREAAGPFDVDFLRRRRAGRHGRGHRAGAADAGHGDVVRAGAAALRGGRRRSRRSPTRARRSTRPTRRTTPSASSAEAL